MKRISCVMGKDDWMHEVWEDNGKMCRTMVPPKVTGDSESPSKTWDGKVSKEMAERIFNRARKNNIEDTKTIDNKQSKSLLCPKCGATDNISLSVDFKRCHCFYCDHNWKK